MDPAPSTRLRPPPKPALRLGPWLLHSPAVALALFSHPFLKIPYDVWEHLIKIRSIFDEGHCFLYWPEMKTTLCAWHHFWAALFHLLGIDSIFAWARIIHSTQTLLAYMAGVLFVQTCLSLMFPCSKPSGLRLLAVVGSWLWLLGNGTRSETYHQTWLLWYSVTYQGMAMPLFWSVAALALRVCFGASQGSLIRYGSWLCILLGSCILAVIHPLELIYVAFFLTVIGLLAAKRILSIGLQETAALLVGLICVGIAVWLAAQHDWIPLPSSLATLPSAELPHRILQVGTQVTRSLNRYPNSFSETGHLALAIGSIWRLSMLRRPVPEVGRRIYDVVLCCSWLFFLIPLAWPLAGAVGLILPPEVVWRFFFASPWFVLLPAAILHACHAWRRRMAHPALVSTAVVLCLAAIVLVASRFLGYGSTFRNARSMVGSFRGDSVGLQFSPLDLEALRAAIEAATPPVADKRIIYYLRGDLGTLARAIFGVYVFTHRLGNLPETSFYDWQLDQRYRLVDVPTPAGISRDPEVFKRFRLEKVQQISRLKAISLAPDLEPLNASINSVRQDGRYVWVEGWGEFASGSPCAEPLRYLVFHNSERQRIFSTAPRQAAITRRKRPLGSVPEAGFSACVPLEALESGEYQLSIYLQCGDRAGIISAASPILINRKTPVH